MAPERIGVGTDLAAARSGGFARSAEALDRQIEEWEVIRFGISVVASEAATRILNYRGSIEDQGTHFGHEHSSIDAYARNAVENLLMDHLPDIEGTRLFEYLPTDLRFIERVNKKRYVLIIDEVDGTTNLKRYLANLPEGDVPKPQSSTCIAVCRNHDLGSTVASAVHTYDTRDTYSSLLLGNHFQVFQNDRLLRPSDFRQPNLDSARGDSAIRIIVAGYSNRRRQELGQWEQQIQDVVKARPYDGCRSTSMDIINMLRGLNDAYVDPRALWPDSGAMLQAYDVAAAIPIAQGCGFVVTDVYGRPISEYGFKDQLPLVVSRTPDLHAKILAAIKPLLEAQELAKS